MILLNYSYINMYPFTVLIVNLRTTLFLRYRGKQSANTLTQHTEEENRATDYY